MLILQNYMPNIPQVWFLQILVVQFSYVGLDSSRPTVSDQETSVIHEPPTRPLQSKMLGAS